MAGENAAAVMVRAYSGVFFGYLVAKREVGESMVVELERSRHVWNWQSNGLPRKALTIDDLAVVGAGDGTKISATVAGVQTLADVKQILPCSAEAVKRFEDLP